MPRHEHTAVQINLQGAVQVLFAVSRTDSQLRFHFPPVFPPLSVWAFGKISPALLSLEQPFLHSLVCEPKAVDSSSRT